MFLRKYLACVEAVFPWMFCCVIGWWMDRLFVEFGHRTTDSSTCIHSDLQYVHWHQAITITACIAQSVYSVTARKRQFKRELMLIGVVEHQPCLIHLYFVQTILCVAWASILCCLIDVSPWLCLENILQYRASISATALLVILCGLVLERKLWSSTLTRAVRLDSKSIDI